MPVKNSLRRWLVATREPSIRYRLLREVDGLPESSPRVRRARVQLTTRGWAASMLAEQLPRGQWSSPGVTGGDLYRPKYISANWRLLVLADMGLTRAHPGIARAMKLMLAAEVGPKAGLGGKGSEVCFTGNAARLLAAFGYLDHPALTACVDWLVDHQKPDGGWHCFPSRSGSLDCWEALAAFAALPEERRSAAVRSSVERGAEFYLSRGLLREGRRPYAPWRRLHYPIHYYYDFLVGLDVLSRLGYGRDPRMGVALDLLERKRNRDGTWSMDALHPDLEPEAEYDIRGPVYPLALELPGRPSRWLTVTALGVLRRAGRA